jgi:hypothetical protein
MEQTTQQITEQITEREMLRVMEDGKPFALRYVTYDAGRRKGGAVREIAEAVLCNGAQDREDGAGESAGSSVRPLTDAELAALQSGGGAQVQAGAGSGPGAPRNPRHSHWYTRNVRVLQAGVPTSLVRKIHPPLVLTFNDKRVLP